MKKGLIFIVSAPAGTGKTTLVRMLLKEFPSVVESVSLTTREPRKSEIQGKDYVYLSHEEFEKKIQEGEFLEYAKVFDHYYGTSKKFVEKEQAAGRHVILVIDTQGALQLKDKIDAIFIFICPPSMEELKKRLKSRQSESPESMKTRLSWAQKEIDLASKYDYKIVNDDLSIAYDALRSILIAEEHRTRYTESD